MFLLDRTAKCENIVLPLPLMVRADFPIFKVSCPTPSPKRVRITFAVRPCRCGAVQAHYPGAQFHDLSRVHTPTDPSILEVEASAVPGFMPLFSRDGV